MANVHIVFGKTNGGNVLNSNTFDSINVVSGNTSPASNAEYNYAHITAIGGSAYVAFSNTTPNASIDPRLYIANNATISVTVRPGTKIAVV